jgi:hypothetical protein
MRWKSSNRPTIREPAKLDELLAEDVVVTDAGLEERITGDEGIDEPLSCVQSDAGMNGQEGIMPTLLDTDSKRLRLAEARYKAAQEAVERLRRAFSTAAKELEAARDALRQATGEA